MVLNVGSLDSAQADGIELADRGHGDGGGGDGTAGDDNQTNNGGECISAESLVGPVCVEIDDVIPILEDND